MARKADNNPDQPTTLMQPTAQSESYLVLNQVHRRMKRLSTLRYASFILPYTTPTETADIRATCIHNNQKPTVSNSSNLKGWCSTCAWRYLALFCMYIAFSIRRNLLRELFTKRVLTQLGRMHLGYLQNLQGEPIRIPTHHKPTLPTQPFTALQHHERTAHVRGFIGHAILKQREYKPHTWITSTQILCQLNLQVIDKVESTGAQFHLTAPNQITNNSWITLSCIGRASVTRDQHRIWKQRPPREVDGKRETSL